MVGGTVIGRVEGVRAHWLAAAGVAAVTALAAASLGGVADSARAGGTSYELVDLGNFSSPVHVDNARGSPGLLFVVKKEGVVRVMRDGEKLPDPFLDISEQVTDGGEEGLLSIAFDPDYKENRRFYVFYANNDHDIQVDQFKRRRHSAVRAASSSQRRTILVPHRQGDNHNGGQLQFGPDGRLYISVGDGGPQQDPENDAQSKRSLLGKVLRIAPRKDGGYGIPASNPYADAPGRDQIFALGLRNPFRFSFDAKTGALVIGDVGGSSREEIDHVSLEAASGANFGWNDYEGFEETAFGIGPNAEPHTPPVFDYPNDPSTCVVTAGYVVRDPGLPGLDGRLLYADFCEGSLRTIDPSAPSPVSVPLGVDASSIAAFGEGVGRQIYVVSLDGDVFALEQSM